MRRGFKHYPHFEETSSKEGGHFEIKVGRKHSSISLLVLEVAFQFFTPISRLD